MVRWLKLAAEQLVGLCHDQVASHRLLETSFDPQEMGEASASREDTVYVFIALWECQQML